MCDVSLHAVHCTYIYINLTAIGLTFMNELIGVQSFARLSFMLLLLLLFVDFVYNAMRWWVIFDYINLLSEICGGVFESTVSGFYLKFLFTLFCCLTKDTPTTTVDYGIVYQKIISNCYTHVSTVLGRVTRTNY